MDGAVRLWHPLSGEAVALLRGHRSHVWSISFSPDSTVLASGSDDRTVRMWDTSSGACIATLKGHGHWVRCLAFSPDGTRLASGSADRTIQLWDTHDQNSIATLEGHVIEVTSVQFSPDGTRLASSAGDSTVRLWHALPGPHPTLSRPIDKIVSFIFSPTGNPLASYTSSGISEIWDTKSGEMISASISDNIPTVPSSNNTRLAPSNPSSSLSSSFRISRHWDYFYLCRENGGDTAYICRLPRSHPAQEDPGVMSVWGDRAAIATNHGQVLILDISPFLA